MRRCVKKPMTHVSHPPSILMASIPSSNCPEMGSLLTLTFTSLTSSTGGSFLRQKLCPSQLLPSVFPHRLLISLSGFQKLSEPLVFLLFRPTKFIFSVWSYQLNVGYRFGTVFHGLQRQSMTFCFVQLNPKIYQPTKKSKNLSNRTAISSMEVVY